MDERTKDFLSKLTDDEIERERILASWERYFRRRRITDYCDQLKTIAVIRYARVQVGDASLIAEAV